MTYIDGHSFPTETRTDRFIAEIGMETVRFSQNYQIDPEKALMRWSRLRDSYVTEQGFSRQELQALEWEADNLLGLLEDVA